MSTGTVTVRGQALVTGRPDEATLTLSLKAIEASHAAAITNVADRSAQLDMLLDQLAVPDAARTTSGVTVHEEREYDRAAGSYRHRGYRSTNTVMLRLEDVELVGKVMTQSAKTVGADIAGPYWHLALTNPAHAEAHRAAATNAKRKAEAYADALGARLGTVLRVTEPSVGFRHSEEIYASATETMASPSAPEPDIEIHAGGLDAAGSVEVTFNLDPR